MLVRSQTEQGPRGLPATSPSAEGAQAHGSRGWARVGLGWVGLDWVGRDGAGQGGAGRAGGASPRRPPRAGPRSAARPLLTLRSPDACRLPSARLASGAQSLCGLPQRRRRGLSRGAAGTLLPPGEVEVAGKLGVAFRGRRARTLGSAWPPWPPRAGRGGAPDTGARRGGHAGRGAGARIQGCALGRRPAGAWGLGPGLPQTPPALLRR